MVVVGVSAAFAPFATRLLEVLEKMKLRCHCGYVFYDNTDRISWKSYLVSDIMLDDALDKGDGDLVSARKLFSPPRPVFECESCGRLWIFDGRDLPWRSYTPETQNDDETSDQADVAL
jgi:hypothetical protein